MCAGVGEKLIKILFMMIFAVLCRQHSKVFFEGGGKLTLISVSYGLRDFGDTVLGLQQESGGPLHSVFFCVGGDRISINRLEYGF